jgi:predicted ABC-type ATPase
MMDLQEQRVAADALAFAKANKRAIAKRLTDPSIYLPEDFPVSVFMAGSPGAGKTEASLEFLAAFSAQILRIDPDSLRPEFESYTGGNSWLFQGAVSVLVEKIHDLALRQKQSFLLDGTLSNYDVAVKNIQRSLDKGRFVLVLYVYQKPELAWQFVKAREKVEGRKIPADEFVRQYFAAREVVNRLKTHFGHSVTVDVFLKKDDGSTKIYRENVDQIDTHIPETYARESLERKLARIGG